MSALTSNQRPVARLPRAVLVASAVLAACLACTGSGDDDGPVAGTYDDPAGDVRGLFDSPAPPEGVGDVTGVVLDEQDGTVSLVVSLDRLPAPDADLSQSLYLTGDRAGRRVPPGTFAVSVNRNRLKPLRAAVTVTDDVREVVEVLCRGRTPATWSPERAEVGIEVPLDCLPGGRFEMTDADLSFGAKGPGFDGADGVTLPDRILLDAG